MPSGHTCLQRSYYIKKQLFNTYLPVTLNGHNKVPENTVLNSLSAKKNGKKINLNPIIITFFFLLHLIIFGFLWIFMKKYFKVCKPPKKIKGLWNATPTSDRKSSLRDIPQSTRNFCLSSETRPSQVINLR